MNNHKENLENIVAKLKQDGIQAGEAEKQRIIDDAKKQAEVILAEARKQAKEIEAEAQAKAAAGDRNVMVHGAYTAQKALEAGKGVMHLLHPLDGLAAAMDAGQSTVGLGAVKVFSTKRACPVCGTSYPELDPRLFSYNSKHGWCTSCVGTGLKLTREQRKAWL